VRQGIKNQLMMTDRRSFLAALAAAAAPGPRQAARRPNVLWLMTDEQRCDSIGAYGAPSARTPAIDELARQGVLFRTALTPSPVCVPARVAVLSGYYPFRTGVLSNTHRTRPDQKFLVEVFAAHGYQTCSIGKHHYNLGRKLFDVQVQRTLAEAVHYFEYRKGRRHEEYNAVRYPRKPWHWILAGRFPEGEEQTSSAFNVRDALAWCDRVDRRRPFLLRVSFNDPHTPVVPPAPYDMAIDPRNIRLRGPDRLPAGAPPWEREGLERIQSAAPLTAQQLARVRQCYYGLVSFLDRQIERLLDGMRKRGLLRNTIVALIADHGTHLGDYGLVQKSSFYEPVVNVPFLFWFPDWIATATIRQPVETLSLLPTLLDLCGLPVPAGRTARASLECCAVAGNLRSARCSAKLYMISGTTPGSCWCGRATGSCPCRGPGPAGIRGRAAHFTIWLPIRRKSTICMGILSTARSRIGLPG
jgi:arylsulfatase